MSEFKDLIFKSIDKLDQWISKNNWKAYDPFDGLNTKFLGRLASNNHYLKIILQQSLRRFPLNLRPILELERKLVVKEWAFARQAI